MQDAHHSAASGACHGKLVDWGIHHSQFHGQSFIRSDAALVGGATQKVVVLRGFGFRQPVLQLRVQSCKMDNTIFAADQLAIRKASRRTATLDYLPGVRIGDALPVDTILRPLQQEFRLCQRCPQGVNLVNHDIRRPQGILEGNLRSLSALHRHRLRKPGNTFPIGTVLQNFGHGVGAGCQIADNGSIGIGCVGPDEASVRGFDLKSPALYGAAVRIFQRLDDLGSAYILIAERNRGCFASLDRDGLNLGIANPVGIIHGSFLDGVGTGFQVDGDQAIGISGILAHKGAAGILDGK